MKSHFFKSLVSKFVFSLLLAVITPVQNASAVYGGTEVLGSEQVVAILDSQEARGSGCTGALLTPRIVLTAAHCLGKIGNYPGELSGDHWSTWVSQPGIDTKVDDIKTRVQAVYVVITDTYTNSYNFETKDNLTTVDDIAFLFLKEAIQIKSYPKIANETQVKRLKQERASITHFGYGLSDVGFQSGKPKKLVLKIRPRKASYEIDNIVPENFSIITNETGDTALCGGDSGGPWYATLDGESLIVANTVGASGCNGPGSGVGGVFGTLVHKYETLLWKKWEFFLANEKEILSWESTAKSAIDARVKALKQAGQYYQEETGCHVKYLIAQLQSNKSGSWKDAASLEGWISIGGDCHQPWTAYRASKGEELRWRLEAKGAWEVFIDPIAETTSEIEESNLAAELKATAGVKAATDANAAVRKKSSITCVKGKLMKKVTSINPKCPAGYKKK